MNTSLMQNDLQASYDDVLQELRGLELQREPWRGPRRCWLRPRERPATPPWYT
jgi:hypothetical protein